MYPTYLAFLNNLFNKRILPLLSAKYCVSAMTMKGDMRNLNLAKSTCRSWTKAAHEGSLLLVLPSIKEKTIVITILFSTLHLPFAKYFNLISTQ